MKQALKYLRRHQPALARRLATLAGRGKIKFVPQSHREVRLGGPLVEARGWLFSISPSGRLNPVRKEHGGAFYCPAVHEAVADGPTVGEEAELALRLP